MTVVRKHWDETNGAGENPAFIIGEWGGNVDCVEEYRKRRQKRLDGREFKESDVIRAKDGRFASKGSSETPKQIQAVLDKTYMSKPNKISEISKVMGRMRIGTKFNYTDDKGVVQIFEKVDKGDDGWEMRSKTKDGYSPPTKVKRSFIAAHMIAKS